MATSDDRVQQYASKIHEVVASHYAKSERALYLAQLGQLVPLPDDLQLRALIKNHCDGLDVVQDPATPTRVAVALADNAERILSWLTATSPSTSDILQELPRPLLYAFSKGAEEGPLFYTFTGRPHYVLANEPPNDNYVEIDAPFRSRLPHFRHIAELTNEVRSDLATRLRAWAKAKGIEIQDLKQRQRRAYEKKAETFERKIGRGSALERLLKAQPAGVMDKLVIPGDIAALLLRH